MIFTETVRWCCDILLISNNYSYIWLVFTDTVLVVNDYVLVNNAISGQLS